MSDMTATDDSIAVLAQQVNDLVQVAGDLVKRVDDLIAVGDRRRWQMVVLGASVFFQAILLVGMFGLVKSNHGTLQRTDDVVRQIAVTNDIVRLRCEANNEAADKQHILWEGVIAQSDAVKPEEVEKFRTLLNETFPVVDCRIP